MNELNLEGYNLIFTCIKTTKEFRAKRIIGEGYKLFDPENKSFLLVSAYTVKRYYRACRKNKQRAIRHNPQMQIRIKVFSVSKNNTQTFQEYLDESNMALASNF